ncbi:PqqD family protein [Staphylococcus aureus]|nr:PqqD family protein [Staphylococcus aureus]
MYRVNPFVKYRNVDGKDYLILNSQVFMMKGIALDVWELISELNKPELVIKNLEQNYDVSYKRLKKDIDKVLNYLEKKNLIIYEEH